MGDLQGQEKVFLEGMCGSTATAKMLMGFSGIRRDELWQILWLLLSSVVTSREQASLQSHVAVGSESLTAGCSNFREAGLPHKCRCTP